MAFLLGEQLQQVLLGPMGIAARESKERDRGHGTLAEVNTLGRKYGPIDFHDKLLERGYEERAGASHQRGRLQMLAGTHKGRMAFPFRVDEAVKWLIFSLVDAVSDVTLLAPEDLPGFVLVRRPGGFSSRRQYDVRELGDGFFHGRYDGFFAERTQAPGASVIP